MARTKNRGFKQSFSPSYTVRRWRLGAYIRLSKEDLKKAREGKDDSNSVKNQRDLLATSTSTTKTNLKALPNMWMTDTQERTPTGRTSNGSFPM